MTTKRTYAVSLKHDLDAHLAGASSEREPLILHLLVPARLQLDITQKDILARRLALHHAASLVHCRYDLGVRDADIK